MSDMEQPGVTGTQRSTGDEPSDQADLQPGLQVGRYVIDSLLGKGSFGTVYKARDPEGQVVALKVFAARDDHSRSRQLIAQQNEIETLRRLDHPSVVKIHEFGLYQDESLYFVMEYAPGDTLAAYLAKRGTLDTLEALAIGRKIADTLVFCHAQNVLHLDLKPSNIILTDPHAPTIKILDFGLSEKLERWWPKNASFRSGTLHYMAPECLASSKRSSPSPLMDIYSVGTILYELMAGHVPFVSFDAATLVFEKPYDKIVHLADLSATVPRRVSQLVARLLQNDPGARLPSAVHLSQALRAAYHRVLADTGNISTGDLAPVTAASLPSQALGSAVAPPGSSTLVHSNAFVGRAEEYAHLLAAYERSLNGGGGGRTVLMVGAPGIGKSRLTAHFLSAPELELDTIIGYGRCRQLGALVTYGGLRELLANLVQTIFRKVPERVVPIEAEIRDDLPLLCRIVPEFEWSDEPLSIPDDAASSLMGPVHIARALGNFLRALARRSHTILVLEDFHWADEGTSDVIQRLVASGLPDRVMLLLNTRPEAGTDTVFEGGLNDPDKIERIELEPLSRADNHALLRSFVGKDAPLDELETAVPLLTAGNPFFNVQVLQSLESEGLVKRTDDGRVVFDDALRRSYAPPTSVAALLDRVFDRLPENVRRVLTVAALCGREFDTAELASLDLFSRADIDQAVEAALACHLCRKHEPGVDTPDAPSESGDVAAERPDGHLVSFAHDAVAERLRARLSGDTERDIHLRIASLPRLVMGNPGLLGHHLEKAGEPRDAAAAFMRAGLDADRLHDPAGACKHLSRALELLRSLPPGSKRDALLVRAAHEFSRVGSMVDAPSTLASIERCADALAHLDGPPLVRVKSALARIHYAMGQFPQAVKLSQECLDPSESGNLVHRYNCVPTNILGRVLAASGKFGPGTKFLGPACDVAEELGEFFELSHSEGVFSVALGYTGEYREAQRRADSCARIAKRLGDPVRTLGSLFYYAVLGETRFDWDLGLRSVAELFAYAEKLEHTGFYLIMGSIFGGRHQFHVGNLDRARVLLERAIYLAEKQNVRMGAGWTHAFLGDVHFVRGERENAMRSYERGLEIGESGGKDEYAAPLALIGLAHCLARWGSSDNDKAQALARAEEARTRFRAVSNRSAMVACLERYAEILDMAGDPDGAQERRAARDRLIRELGVADHPWVPETSTAARQPAPARPPADVGSDSTTLSPETGYSVGAHRTISGDDPSDEATMVLGDEPRQGVTPKR